MSHSLRGFKKLYDTVINNNIFLQVGFQRRYHPHLSEIHQIIKSRFIGDITNAIFTVASYVPFWHPYEDYKKLYACR